MSDDFTDEDLNAEPGLVAADEAPQDGSVWAVARSAHADLTRKQTERKPLELDVPGADGIVVRFKFVRLADTEKTTKGIAALRERTDQARYAAIDTLLLACDEILVRLPDGITPLADPGSPPVRFDHRLCDGMGWPRVKARQIVHKLYGGEKGEYAMIEAAQEVSAWMTSTDDEVADPFGDG